MLINNSNKIKKTKNILLDLSLNKMYHSKRFFTKKIKPEFDINPPDFDFNIKDDYILTHSTDLIQICDDFDIFIDSAINHQSSYLNRNLFRINIIDRDLES